MEQEEMWGVLGVFMTLSNIITVGIKMKKRAKRMENINMSYSYSSQTVFLQQTRFMG